MSTQSLPLSTDRLKLLPWSTDDYEFFLCLFMSADVQKWSRRIGPENGREELARFISWNRDSCVAAKIFVNGLNANVGNACLLKAFRGPGYELAYHLLPQYTGNGYASETVQRLCAYYNEARLHDGLFASVSPENQASIALLHRCNFRKEFSETLKNGHLSDRYRWTGS